MNRAKDLESSGKPEHAASRGRNRNVGADSVEVRVESIVLPTYLPAAPDKNPMFLETRVYQGSSGKVYPLPFTDRIAEKPVDRKWRALWIENQFIRALVLPEIGGRIHILQDKSNGYDAIYNQSVIKPALVGLAGPWISGGIEFNWPQHHRPATFLPVDFEIEEHADGSKTIWCSDHDPLTRMKGMHGICLHPGKSLLELKVRAYNRTPFVQTFLWWANVATRVHEQYQSFFPPDVYYVADHARRSMSEYPLAQSHYYGVDYGARRRKGIPKNEIPSQFAPPHCHGDASSYRANDLSFYANIPVPTSYMCMGSAEDFFGGYDYAAQAGIVHVANHHIAPGKKQWTWGNHDFGYAWDRNLTDADANGTFWPYIEIMAGVYTDNQPDFSFLQPGETKTWSQFWYPIQKIGPAQHANLDAALSMRIEDGRSQLGIAVTEAQPKAIIILCVKQKEWKRFVRDLSPSSPFLEKIDLPKGATLTDLSAELLSATGRTLIAYRPKERTKGEVPPPATEPPPPEQIASADELFITGLHLEQYRHATRSPVPYWREVLRRDPFDSRCNNAMGRWHLQRGEFAEAEQFFRTAIERLTSRNANPYDGEAFYNLGLCLRYQERDEAAYDALYKATWNQAWAAAAYHALAEIDCLRHDWETALPHLSSSLRWNTDNLRALNLKTMVLRKLNRLDESAEVLRATLRLDPLDWWARHVRGEQIHCDLQVRLDLAHDLARAGLFEEAIEILKSGGHFKPADLPDQSWGAQPLVEFTLGWLHGKLGDEQTAGDHFSAASALPADYCFPSRLEEISVLQAAMAANPKDARAPYYLGNLFYDRRRHEEAIRLWENSARLDPSFSIVWRNLGIGYFDITRKSARARRAYEKAFRANPADARLLYERNQLWRRMAEEPRKRLKELEKFPELTEQRDDLSLELCTLYNQTGQYEKAAHLLGSRQFQPWEGGEGGPLAQHARARVGLGHAAMTRGDFDDARTQFECALKAPPNLSEARHLLANVSDIHYWLGCALAEIGDQPAAREHWRIAADFKGDFQEMSVRAFSEMTYYSALSLEKLGDRRQAKRLLSDLLDYARKLEKTPARIDYFATSLPTMLLFADDLQFRQTTSALFLQAQAHAGRGAKAKAQVLLQTVLRRDPNHGLASDFLARLR